VGGDSGGGELLLARWAGCGRRRWRNGGRDGDGDGGVGGGGELWLGTRTELPQVLWDPRWEDRTGSRDVGELEGKPTKKKPRGKTGSS
jgi:hypothetical protein